jgi:geranylgeranyl pyrophosphate synthase
MNLTSEVSAFDTRVPAYLHRLEHAMGAHLPSADTDPDRLHQAMRYACSGGKHLRALLVYASGEALGVEPEQLDTPACAVEFIHAYSLVHDDLPGMDNDDLRRGHPTVHKAYDEAIAILVGDALQTLAFGVLANANALDAEQKVGMISCLALASGSLGMAGGQAVDMASEGCILSIGQLESLHGRKTGALIRAACQLAGIAAKAHVSTRQALDQYGKCLGLAFQIQDDVLDLIADTITLGKTAGKDQAQHKSTFPSVLGLEQAQHRAAALFNEARGAARNVSSDPEPLLWLTDYIQQRDH